ncbi:MAG: hypothetical protein AAGA60_12340 [Cyanobacteria bacterium P01_E01_bin.42]
MKKLVMIAVGLIMLVSVLTSTPAYADIPAKCSEEAIIGNEAIDRSVYDGWSNFVLGLTNEVFAEAGTVSEWKVYVNNPGSVGMLLLRQQVDSTYKIIGSDIETAKAGLNQFTFTPKEGGSAKVETGDILGLYIGSAKVDFDSGTDDKVGWCGGNGCITNVNTQLAAGQTISINHANRRYSANATVFPCDSVDFATIINIDSTKNLSPDEGVKVTLPAASYTVSVIGKEDGGVYDAWTKNSRVEGCDENGLKCKKGWEHKYFYQLGDAKKVKVKQTGRYETPEQALENPPADITFTLTEETEVSFFVKDPKNPANNQGGVSLQIVSE